MQNPWRGLRGLPASVWLLSLATLINRVGTMVLAFLVLYLTRHEGYTPGGAGAMLALYGTVAICIAPVAGRLCDRYGALPVIAAGLLGNGAALLLFPLAHGPWVVLAVFALSVTNEAARPGTLAAVTAWSAPAERRMAFALLRLAINLGVSVGPALGGFLAARSFLFLFWIDAGTSLAAGLVLLVAGIRLGLARRPEGTGRTAGERPKARGGSPYADLRFLVFFAVNLLVTMVFFQHNSTMSFHLVHNLSLSPAAYGAMFTLNTLLILALEVPLNTAMAGWPLPRALALGALLSGLGFGGLGLVSTAPGVVATVVVWTFGEMILFPTAAAYAAHCAPVDRQGAYMGAYSMSSAAAFALGPWLGMRVLETWGAGVLWGGVLLAGLVAAALFWRMEDAPRAPILEGVEGAEGAPDAPGAEPAP